MEEAIVEISSLSLELVAKLVEEAKGGNILRIKEVISDGFGDSHVLNQSFLVVCSLSSRARVGDVS